MTRCLRDLRPRARRQPAVDVGGGGLFETVGRDARLLDGHGDLGAELVAHRPELGSAHEPRLGAAAAAVVDAVADDDCEDDESDGHAQGDEAAHVRERRPGRRPGR